MGRRTYNKEYKLSAVKLVIEESQSITEVSRNLCLSTSAIYKWVQEYKEYGENAFPGKGTAIYNQQYKQRVLEKENAALKEEITLLKKYRAFLKQAKK